jgi:hypothetical protein
MQVVQPVMVESLKGYKHYQSNPLLDILTQLQSANSSGEKKLL